ncbi:hypothetical protein HDK64DRAFT_258992 [Phyllosticta capitalensis]
MPSSSFGSPTNRGRRSPSHPHNTLDNLATTDPITIETLPTEMLLNVVGWVGTMSPVTHEHGKSALLNLSLTSKTMRDACLRLLFRGVIIDVEDTVGSGKHSHYFSASTFSAEMRAAPPSMVAKARSFAIKTRGEDSNAPKIDNVTVQRAMKMACKILAGAKMLKKLHIRLPFSRTSVESPVHSSLHFVEELLVNPTACSFIKHCRNVHTLAAVGFTTTGGHLRGLRHAMEMASTLGNLHTLEIDQLPLMLINILPHIPHLQTLKLVLDLPPRAIVGLFDVVFELKEKTSHLRALTLVMAGPGHGQSDCWKLFRYDIVVEGWSDYFFERLLNLQDFSIACITRVSVSDAEPRLVSSFHCQRRNSNSANYLGPIKRLTLPRLDHREWVPSHEGPP